MRALPSLVLALVAVACVVVAPRVLETRRDFRRAPRAALLLWQAISLGGLLAAVLAAPLAVTALDPQGSARHDVLAALALVLSFGVLGRVALAGHRVGSRLRAARSRHRTLVDLIGTSGSELGRDVRVVDHPTPTAYCLPGLRQRVVLSASMLQSLPPDQLQAVLVHERAHLDQRHDLVLEWFTVMHEAAPASVRHPRGLEEVRLLVEALADRCARRAVGEVSLARAIVTLQRSRSPEGGLSAGAATKARMELLVQDRDHPRLAAGLYAAAGACVAFPVLVTAWALVTAGS